MFRCLDNGDLPVWGLYFLNCLVYIFIVVIFFIPQGNRLQFECSFNMDYDDVNDSDALKWNIDSVCVVPSDCKEVESVYSVETDQLSLVSTPCNIVESFVSTDDLASWSGIFCILYLVVMALTYKHSSLLGARFASCPKHSFLGALLFYTVLSLGIGRHVQNTSTCY